MSITRGEHNRQSPGKGMKGWGEWADIRLVMHAINAILRAGIFRTLGLFLLICVGTSAGCATAEEGDGMQTYFEALEATAPGKAELIEEGSEIEARAIAQFKELFELFEADRLRGGITALYAENAYFRDTFTELNNAQDIEEYFVRSAKAVDECRFDIQDVAISNGEYYFRWIMSLRLERYKDQPADKSVGMTHIRFNKDGKIIFHQDYWDAANLYEKFPVMGGIIRWAKRRIEGE